MSRTITLTKNVRVFRRQGDINQLYRTGAIAESGGKFDVSEPKPMIYDHRDQMAVSFHFLNETYYMLVSEMGAPELETIKS